MEFAGRAYSSPPAQHGRFSGIPLHWETCHKQRSSAVCEAFGRRVETLGNKSSEKSFALHHTNNPVSVTVAQHWPVRSADTCTPGTSAAAGNNTEVDAVSLEERLNQLLKWDGAGLVVAVVQNADTGAVLMQGFANANAVAHTLTTGRATFFSRSRQSLWTKGETSGNFIRVLDVFVDCDKDTLIYWGLPDGPTCHTGEETCFFSTLSGLVGLVPQPAVASSRMTPLSSLFAVERTIADRQHDLQQQQQHQRGEEELGGSSGIGTQDSGPQKKPSWTQRLLTDPKLLCSKVREEADELARTMEESEGAERTASEMADLLYHSLVLLRAQGVSLEIVAVKLRDRFGRSGIEEKLSRGAVGSSQDASSGFSSVAH